MSSKELSEWIAYFRIEPMPDPWLQTGIECATTANVQGGKSAPKDFIPRVEDMTVSVEANRSKLAALAARQKR
jgi:hypothetical protein